MITSIERSPLVSPRSRSAPASGGVTSCTCAGNGTWSAQPSGTQEDLNAVAGGFGQVYAVGTLGTILHSTGNGKWKWEPNGVVDPLYAVAVRAADDVYAGGNGGVMVRSHGDGCWSVVDAIGAMDNWWAGRAAGGEVIFVGAASQVARSTGTGFGAEPVNVNDPLYGVAAAGGKYFAVGANALIVAGGP